MSTIATVGLDLSMTSTGIAALHEGAFELSRVKSTAPPAAKGKKKPPWSARFDRLDLIASQVIEHIPYGSFVVLEGPSYASTGSSSHDIAGNWWNVGRIIVREHGCALLVVTPSQLKKYATGKGTAAKDAVLAATVRRYPDLIAIDQNDVSDAVNLLAIGRRLLGSPIEDSMPKVNLSALDELQGDFAALGLAIVV